LSEWERCRLGDIAEVVTGNTPPKNDSSNYGDEYLLVRPAELGGDVPITDAEVKLSSQGMKKTRTVPKDSVLVCCIGSIGKIGIAGVPLATNQQINSVVFKKTIDPKFGFYYLKSRAKHLAEKANNSVVAIINKTDFSNTEFRYPPLEEQRRIATILDKADAIRRKRQKALTLVDDFLRSTFLEMFGDPVVNPKGYPEHSLGNLVDVRDGTHDSPKYVDEGYPLITSKNVTGGRLDFSKARNISERDFIEIGKRSSVEKGNILMPMIGTIGKPIIVDTDRQFAIKNVALLRTDGADPLTVFLLELLKGHYLSHAILKSSRGGTQKFIALSDIRSLPICLPPKEQLLEFSSIVQKIEGLKVQMANACVYSDQFFEASSQRLFRGDF
jgi:type I restriction enzyme S subunit